MMGVRIFCNGFVRYGVVVLSYCFLLFPDFFTAGTRDMLVTGADAEDAATMPRT